jgi:mevalonate pyrophosphate decarboxylase
MFVAKKRRIGSGGKSRALYAPRHPFWEWVTYDNEIARKHTKYEFWTQSSGLGMFVVKNEEMVPVAKTHALYAPPLPFSEWVTCGNEIARNHPKHEFWT